MTHEHPEDLSFTDLHLPTEHPIGDTSGSDTVTHIPFEPPPPEGATEDTAGTPEPESADGPGATHDEQLGDSASLAPDDGFPGPDSSVAPDGSQLDGTPAQDTQYWFEQCASGWCGPASIAMVFDQMTGAHVDDQNISSIADSMGYVVHNPDGSQGMDAPGISGTLTQLGIPNHISTGSIASLTHALASGDRVIAAVDGEKIWGEQDPDKADHAVEITGIDVQDGLVYLNDPGTPDGAAEHVPLDTFEQAWGTSGNQMVVTDNPVSTVFDHSDPNTAAPNDTTIPTTAPANGGGDVTQTPATSAPSTTDVSTPSQSGTPTESGTPTQSGTPAAATSGGHAPSLSLPPLPVEHHEPSGPAILLPIRLIAELIHDI